MPAPRIRCEYDVLDQIAKKFFNQADLTNQSFKGLRTKMETLQGGDWIGEGAKKFCGEMNSAVLPSVKRLAHALKEGGQVTQKIIQIMHQADEDAARLISLPGSGVEASGIVSVMTKAVQAAADSAAEAAERIAAKHAAACKAVDKLLSKVDPKVRELVKKSPTLAAQIQSLDGKVTFEMGPKGSKDAYYDGDKIVIGPGESINEQVSTIAHEVGHAKYGIIPYHKPTPGMTKAEYIRKNVREDMLDEGSAQLNAAIVRDEVKKGGGPTLGMPGTQEAKYLKVYNDYKKGTITRQQAIEKNAKLMGNETTGKKSIPYKDHYGKYYENKWKDEMRKGKTKR